MGLMQKIKRKAKTFDNMIRPLANDKWDYFIIALDVLWCRYIELEYIYLDNAKPHV